VADFILTVLAALIVGGIGFGLFSFVAGRDPGLAEPVPDGVGDDPPDDLLADGPFTAGAPLTAEGLEASRFDVAIRGYRMSQVDALMERAAHTIRDLEDRVGELEGVRPVADRAPADGGPAEVAPAEAAPAEAAVDPAR
jgi:DivIVA domain-containing protein